MNTTVITTGNVAAYRKSLENKVVETTSAIEKPSRKSFDVKKETSMDFRKSMESLDDKKTSTPPPVLTKKPIVPVKKSPTVSSVTGSIFAGLKNKVKSERMSSNDSLDEIGNSRVTTGIITETSEKVSIFSGLKNKVKSERISSNDSLDGIGSSRVTTGHIADNSDKGIVGERLRKDDSEFDHVERSSILQDMRASRAKAPKRRLPTNSNSMGSGENISATYQNGGNGISDGLFEGKSDGLDDDGTKAKPRNWEKKKVPWMDELKASQAKKTSPNVEARSPDNQRTQEHDISEKFDMSKSFSSSFGSSHKKSMDMSNFEMRSSSVDVKAIAGLEAVNKKDTENIMVKSLSSVSTKMSVVESSTSSVIHEENLKVRPTSVNLRNRSISPVARVSLKSMPVYSPEPSKPPLPVNVNHEVVSAATITPVTMETVCTRVIELEQKVLKLEKLVQRQHITIEELIKSSREEADRVKTLKSELDKYAQCVTQV